jgi:hypothetical protein
MTCVCVFRVASLIIKKLTIDLGGQSCVVCEEAPWCLPRKLFLCAAVAVGGKSSSKNDKNSLSHILMYSDLLSHCCLRIFPPPSQRIK